jgi:adenosylhomocysteine nucleosidase
MLFAAPSHGSEPTDMSKTAIVAALEREVSALIKGWTRVPRQHEGRTHLFFEHADTVVVCGGIGAQAARRAAEAVISLYRPTLVQSVGFAGALDASLRVGDIFSPATVIDARDASRIEISTGKGTLITFMDVASAAQKTTLAHAYAAQAVDMEAAAVAAAAHVHGVKFGAIKVISDELTFEMPQTARFIDAHGRFHTASFALFVTVRPWLWPRVATLAQNSHKAAIVLSNYLLHFRQPQPESSGPEVHLHKVNF